MPLFIFWFCIIMCLPLYTFKAEEAEREVWRLFSSSFSIYWVLNFILCHKVWHHLMKDKLSRTKSLLPWAFLTLITFSEVALCSTWRHLALNLPWSQHLTFNTYLLRGEKRAEFKRRNH
jgi:hypothetical protein